jgi:predicted DNA-binding ribbon-helix-helix protein
MADAIVGFREIEDGQAASSIVKRSITINNHRTSISLESEFWSGIREICKARKATLRHVIGEIERQRRGPNLSSEIRVFVLRHYRSVTKEQPSIPAVTS